MNVSVYMKLLDYLYLVLFNWSFVEGVVAAYVARAYLGGSSVSLVSGMVIGLCVYEVIKYVGFN